MMVRFVQMRVRSRCRNRQAWSQKTPHAEGKSFSNAKAVSSLVVVDPETWHETHLPVVAFFTQERPHGLEHE